MGHLRAQFENPFNELQEKTDNQRQAAGKRPTD
jgi:hypothetical protein